MQHLISVAVFVAAIVCYVSSGPGYAGLLLLLGVVLEGVFWYRMLVATKNPRADNGPSRK